MFAPVDGLLRTSGPFAPDAPRIPWKHLAWILVVCGSLYGAAMGMYGARPLQALYSGLKVPFLLAFTSLVCLPNFFVVNSLLGLRDDFARAFCGVVAAQATMAVALASLAPFTLLVYASSSDHDLAVVMNAFFFLVAALTGQITLGRHYAPLIQRNPRHRIGKATWLTLYVFVAIQLAWVLRPFIGHPGLPVTFFRKGAWSNAYVELFRYVQNVLT